MRNLSELEIIDVSGGAAPVCYAGDPAPYGNQAESTFSKVAKAAFLFWVIK